MFVGHRKAWNSWTYAHNRRPHTQVGTGYASTSLDGGPNYAWRGPQYHKGSVNFLFVDGHAAFMSPDTLGRDWHTGSLTRHWARTRHDLLAGP